MQAKISIQMKNLFARVEGAINKGSGDTFCIYQRICTAANLIEPDQAFF